MRGSKPNQWNSVVPSTTIWHGPSARLLLLAPGLWLGPHIVLREAAPGVAQPTSAPPYLYVPQITQELQQTRGEQDVCKAVALWRLVKTLRPPISKMIPLPPFSCQSTPLRSLCPPPLSIPLPHLIVSKTSNNPRKCLPPTHIQLTPRGKAVEPGTMRPVSAQALHARRCLDTHTWLYEWGSSPFLLAGHQKLYTLITSCCSCLHSTLRSSGKGC